MLEVEEKEGELSGDSGNYITQVKVVVGNWRRHSVAYCNHGGHTLPELVCDKTPLSHPHVIHIIHVFL